jgi:hypothetical protein
MHLHNVVGLLYFTLQIFIVIKQPIVNYCHSWNFPCNGAENENPGQLWVFGTLAALHVGLKSDKYVLTTKQGTKCKAVKQRKLHCNLENLKLCPLTCVLSYCCNGLINWRSGKHLSYSRTNLHMNLKNAILITWLMITINILLPKIPIRYILFN